MKIKCLKLPAIIIAIGLVLSAALHCLTSINKMPTVTERDFDFSITYKLDGETKTVQGICSCAFNGFEADGYGPDRYYKSEYTFDGSASESRTYTIAQKDGIELYIVTQLNYYFLMGDTKNDDYGPNQDPYLEAVDQEGYAYDEETIRQTFDAEIISWEQPEPIANTFVFAGFTGFHPNSLGAILLAGFSTLAACLVFVKKEEGVVYNSLDIIGIVLNFAIGIIGIPLFSLTACMIQAFKTSVDWIYQADFLVPILLLFSLSASVSLRRKGFRLSGFFIQFIGPALLFILSFLEYIL